MGLTVCAHETSQAFTLSSPPTQPPVQLHICMCDSVHTHLSVPREELCLRIGETPVGFLNQEKDRNVMCTVVEGTNLVCVCVCVQCESERFCPEYVCCVP